jgi:succinate dehydrogenase / fumarate reductase cytochrome b subunit
MENNKKRPTYLNLFTIRLPIGGVVSIIHRITGVALALLVPAGIYLLQLSLESPHSFYGVVALLDSFSGRVVLIVLLWIFAQHFFSGLRHLFLDIDVGVGKTAARCSAWLTWAGSVLTVLGALLCL